jgi:hypothetical protein
MRVTLLSILLQRARSPPSASRLDLDGRYEVHRDEHRALFLLVQGTRPYRENSGRTLMIEICDTFPAFGFSGMEHARTPVAVEERHPRIAGRLLRLPCGRPSR